MFIVSAIATTLYLGAWHGILPGKFIGLPGPIWFLLKCLLLIFIQMWLRWTLPRLRVDQLMYLSWKVLLPISIFCLLGQGIWILLWR
jgi:NADH-quinone oxidoreductase subunit H